MRNTEGRHQTVEESIRKLTNRVQVLEKKVGLSSGIFPEGLSFEAWRETQEYRDMRDAVCFKAKSNF